MLDKSQHCEITGCIDAAHVTVRYGMLEPMSTHTNTLCRSHTAELFDRYKSLLAAGLAHWTNGAPGVLI